MQVCPYCKVKIAGAKNCCPLCGGTLTGEPSPETEVFPVIEQKGVSDYFLLRVFALAGVVVSLICLMVNAVVSTRFWWSLFVVAGVACVWLAVKIGFAYRRDMLQNIAWQAAIIPALAVLWDKFTGWRGWSITFVLPCIVAVALLTIVVLAIARQMPVQRFAGNLGVVCLLGLASGILAICGAVSLVLPSLIAAGAALLVQMTMLIFHWQTFREELTRRFHL